MSLQQIEETSIEDQLTELVDEIRANVPQIGTWPSIAVSMALVKAMRDPNNSVAKFQARVLADGTFGELRGGWLESFVYRSQVETHRLPLCLIVAVLRGTNPGLVIKEARGFAASKTSKLRTYYAIAGVSITAPIDLSPTMRLLNWADVPDSSTKQRLSPKAGGNIIQYPTEDFIRFRAYPGCAVEINPQIELRLLPSYNQSYGSGEDRLAYINGEQLRSELAEDIVRCFFLIGVKPAGIVAQWPFAIDPFAQRCFGGMMQYENALFELLAAQPSDCVIDSSELHALWNSYSALSPDVKQVIRHAIERLNFAKRRPSIVDRAIDLGIALEMLLLHRISDKTELKHRLSLRGTAFIGGEHEVRMSNYQLLKEVYDLRSSAVHNGRFVNRQLDAAPDLIEKGVGLGAEIVRKLIGLGKFPDWEAEYLIGGELNT